MVSSPLHDGRGAIERELTYASKVDLAGAERRNGFDEMQILALWDPQAREFRAAQPLPQILRSQFGVSVEGDEAFAFGVVRDRGDDGGRVIAEQRLDFLFDLHVRHHLAGDLAEARESIGDADEATLVDGRDVAGDVPAI